MSGNVGFEWEYKIKLTTLFLQISLKNGTHINYYSVIDNFFTV
jgi:hypothetical protein